jgi:hypothetical protein
LAITPCAATGRGGGVDDHAAVVADDDAGVRVALGRVGVGVVAEFSQLIFFSSRSAWEANFLSVMALAPELCGKVRWGVFEAGLIYYSNGIY